MSLMRRLEKIEEQIRAPAVCFTIRTWEDYHRVRREICRQHGYAGVQEVIDGEEDFCIFERWWNEMAGSGELIVMQEFELLRCSTWTFWDELSAKYGYIPPEKAHIAPERFRHLLN